MSIVSGQLLHTYGGAYLVDRLQTSNTTLNTPKEKIPELGNYKHVGVLYDIPEVSLALQSFDQTTTLETLLLGEDELTSTEGYDFTEVTPMNLQVQLKDGARAASPYNISASATMAGLTAQSISYNYAVQQSVTTDVTLAGNHYCYAPEPGFTQSKAGSGAALQEIELTYPAGPYTDSAGTRYALAVTVDGEPQTLGVDYIETVTALEPVPNPDLGYKKVTITITDAIAATSTIEVLYYSSQTLAAWEQKDHTPDSDLTPMALRGKNIEVYLGETGYDPDDIPASQAGRWSNIRELKLDWAWALEADYELGNPVAPYRSSAEPPTVNGSVTIRPNNVENFIENLQLITGVDPNIAMGPSNSTPLILDIVIKSATGVVLKRLRVPDARFIIPNTSVSNNQKIDWTLEFESDEGSLLVFSA